MRAFVHECMCLCVCVCVGRHKVGREAPYSPVSKLLNVLLDLTVIKI